MVTEIGRRDRKRISNHLRLRSAALRLVAEHGLNQVTVEEIADAADVSIRTFFNHFHSKEDVIVGLDPELVEHLAEELGARPADEPPLVALRAVLGELTAQMMERSEEWSLRMEVLRRYPSLIPRAFAAFATYERALAEVIGMRTNTDPDRDLYPALATAVAFGVFRVVFMSWRGGELAGNLPALLDEAFSRVSEGLPSPDLHDGSGGGGSDGRSESASGEAAGAPAALFRGAADRMGSPG
ncbi:MAG TPA: TetR family transcriptional regulator [Candidatus Dormibacteraeota bacterium]|nr:TetR family transcriptional regulator [Candidatus Dormibacteraeota bacterium]